MDETGFSQKHRSKKVIAMTGSRNVWSRDVGETFHMTIACCVGAEGTAVHPFYILPGQRVDRDILDGVLQKNSCVTLSNKGFMMEHLFRKWMSHFKTFLGEKK